MLNQSINRSATVVYQVTVKLPSPSAPTAHSEDKCIWPDPLATRSEHNYAVGNSEHYNNQ